MADSLKVCQLLMERVTRMDELVNIVCRAAAASVHAYFQAIGLMKAEYKDMHKTWYVFNEEREGVGDAECTSFTDVYINFGIYTDCDGEGCVGECCDLDTQTFCLSYEDNDLALAVMNYLSEDEDTWMHYDM